MELFREWFFWGESDLFFFGIAVILASAFLPWKNSKRNHILIFVCTGIYILAELVVSFFWQNMILTFAALFLGGVALSIAIGRLLRLVARKLAKIIL